MSLVTKRCSDGRQRLPGRMRDEYTHVLSTFSHSSYKDAPRQCLAAFDELQQIGLDAFTKKHDPYWEMPLNENLPESVIDLRNPEPAPDARPPSRIASVTFNSIKRRRRTNPTA